MQKKKKWLNILLAVTAFLAIGLIGFGAFHLFQEQQEVDKIDKEAEQFASFVSITEPEKKQEEKEGSDDLLTGNPLFSIDWNELQQLNPDVQGWIYVPDSDISFPIVYSDNVLYYLNHTYLKEENMYGAIFFSQETPPDFSADNTIIYGHSSDVGNMFSGLAQFQNQQFFESHPIFWVLTPQKSYKVSVIAFMRVNTSHPVYNYGFGDYKKEVLEAIKKDALQYRPQEIVSNKFVTLSTCDLNFGYNSVQRNIVFGQVVEP